MYSITDLKKDTLIQIDNQPYRVVSYAQKQLGRGGSIVNVKLKNLINGSTLDKTYKGNDKIEPANVNKQTVQYLYSQDKKLFFMNQESYEQFEVEQSILSDSAALLKEGQEVTAQSFDGVVISVELPIKINLAVSEAPNAVKGDTQSTVMKDVTLETGVVIQAPLFIKAGDTVIVDTRDISYVERAK